MKKLILVFVLMGFVQAQSASNWIILLPGLYYNPVDQAGIAGFSASPGEFLARVFSYTIENDYIGGNCSLIYFEGASSNIMKFKRLNYFAFIPKTSRYYSVVKSNLKDKSLFEASVDGGVSFCNYGRSQDSELFELEYEVPFSNPVVIMQNLRSTKVKYSIDSENNAHLEVVDAKPAQ
jgi:hypothetical protein